MPKKLSIKIGDTFGKLTVIDTCWLQYKANRRRTGYICECECGHIWDRCEASSLIKGDCKSSCCSGFFNGNTKHPNYLLFHSLKTRAKALGILFELEMDDIIIPEVCPLLGIPIIKCSGDNSPSVDRLYPERGYIPSNIKVISMKANRIKNDATLEEMLLLTENLPKYLKND